MNSPMRFSLRQLSVFATVAQTEHVGRAAQLLDLSQPTVSADISSLERALKVELLVRSPAGTRLTEAGTSLLPQVQDVLASAERLDAGAARMVARSAGPVRLAATPSLVNRLVPALLHRVASQEDTLGVDVIEVPTGGLTRSLAAGEADVGVGHFVGRTPDTETARIADDEMCVLTSAGDLDPTHPVDLPSLAGRKLLIWPRSQDEEYFDAVVEACRCRGLDPEVLESSTRFSGAQSYHLTGGEAFSVVPFDFAREASKSLSYAPFDPPLLAPLQVIWRQSVRDWASQIVDLLRLVRGSGHPVSGQRTR